ncbi:MAG TPA: CotH kinase family protein [Tepidisphaeraceae bacterium]|nr:CotH kinase family protein [Tepidisphaeraceae bacterium]
MLLLAVPAVAAAADADKRAKKKDKEPKPDPSAEFFAPTTLHTIHIQITYDQFQQMQPTRRARPAPLDAASIPAPVAKPAPAVAPVPAGAPDKAPRLPAQEGKPAGIANYGYEYPYVKAQVEIDNVPLADVGVRYKGNSSYNATERGLKRPMKLDFNRFKPGQDHLGIESLNLANNAFDISLMRETICYATYRAAGVPAPRTTLATVYLSVEGHCRQEYIGLYTLVEEVDGDQFLDRHFGKADLPVFKPEAIRGLPYMGEDIANYAERYRPKNKITDPAAARPLIEFLKLLNYADDQTFNAEIEKVFDVDGFLNYLAVTGVVCHLDSNLANNHNFYLVVGPPDKKAGRPSRVHWLPWDMNLALATYGGGGEQLVNLDVRHPWGGTNRLCERILAVDKYRDAYLKHVRNVVTVAFNSAVMDPLIDRVQSELLEAEEAAAASIPQTRMGPIGLEEEKGRAWRGSGRMSPRAFIAARAAAVVAQLDGTHDPAKLFVPAGHNPGAVRAGVRASVLMGNLSLMAQAVRQAADKDGDFHVSPREARDAAAALYVQLADEDKPESIDAKTLAARLDPLVTAFSARPAQDVARLNQPRDRGRRQPQPDLISPGEQWARVILAFADADHDGKLTVAELTAATDRLFAQADADRTGLLGEREILEALDDVAAPEKAPTPP